MTTMTMTTTTTRVAVKLLLLCISLVPCQSNRLTAGLTRRFPWGPLAALPLLSTLRGGTATTNTEQKAVSAIIIYPDWFSPLDHDALQPFLELARQRHEQAVQKAKDSYYHHSGTSSEHSHVVDEMDDDLLSSLAFDEFDIKSTQRLPDFHDELQTNIFVTKTPLFTKEECRNVIDLAEDHFAGNDWTRMASGQYQVAGFWIRSVPAVHAWFNRMVQRRLFPLLAQKFPNFITDPAEHSMLLSLVVDNAYLFKYTPETGRRTDVHTDSGCLSFTIALNQREEDFQGGGTWFEGLSTTTTGPLPSDQDHHNNSVLEMNVGQVTIRPGGVRHCGHAVTEGVRYIIGGFCMRVDKVEPVRQLVGLASELLQQEQVTDNNEQQQHWDYVEQVLHAALTLNPYFDGIYTHLARLYQTCGQATRARQVLEHCHAHVNSKSGEVAYSLGLLCMKQGDCDQVRSCMRTCLEADANDVDAMALMAQAIAYQRQRRAEAGGDLKQKDEEEEEDSWYRRIIQNPNATPQQLASAYCNLGVLHEGRDDELAMYVKSLDYDPSSFATWYSLACAMATQRQYGSAGLAFRQAIFRAGDDDDDDDDDKKENRSKALHSLYRLAVTQLQEGPPNRFASQQEMLEELKRIMGAHNYDRLAAEHK